MVRVKDILFQVSLCTAIHWLMPPQERRVSGQEVWPFPAPPPPSQELGSAAGTTSKKPPSCPGLYQPPFQSSTKLLPACLPFLPFPPLNRLQQQDGTNLWLNSPKITRDLSKAVCVKLTGACTLLSNALSSEASPGTPLRRCLPVPGLPTLPGPTAPPHLALPWTLRGVSQRRGAQLSAPVPGKGARRRVLASPHPHQSCAQSGSSVCQPVLLQLVHVSRWPVGRR